MIEVDAKHKVRVSFQNIDRSTLRDLVFGKGKSPRRRTSLTRLKSHIRTVLSSDALARKSPSDAQATSEIPPECPCRVFMISPVYVSHILINLSAA